MKPTLRIAAIIMALSSLTSFAQAQTTEKKSLTIDGAKKVIAAAVAYAKKNNAPGGVIAVVDEGGNLMALERLDGTFAAGANISIGKARTAVLFKRPTKAFEDIIKNGRTAMVALPDAYFTPLQGGVPITVDGQIVGGVGVSGASSAQQDEELAMAGANVFSADAKMSDATPMKSSPVLFFDKTQVSASFSKGAVLFTDPPFGVPKAFEDARKELPFSGVFSIYKGKLQLVSKDFTGPNGIAFSPDEKYLYVGNWPRAITGQHPRAGDEPVSEIGEKHKAIMRYEVQADGTLKNGKLFFDFTNAPGEDGLDGIKVDQKGNLYVSGPGGLWVISPEGKHLGTIITPRHAHNFNWGDADGKTLYLCARSGLYRIRLNIAGVRP